MATPRNKMQNELLGKLMNEMDGHLNAHQARAAWNHILELNEFEKNTNPDYDYYNSRDKVFEYVSNILDPLQYWGSTAQCKLHTLHTLAGNMELNSACAKTAYSQMGDRMQSKIEHDLRSWIYFHDRIVEVLYLRIMWVKEGRDDDPVVDGDSESSDKGDQSD
ncbi:hypothetical protein QBC39DRAFT_432007 [Podospora conica]|nr:hypothetical protein QBC39DRAFT_432007 [Schizothecium conicum]